MKKIVIIEDDQNIAEGLKYSIEYNKKYMVSEMYSTAEEALLNIKSDNPELIILDISLPGKSGVEIISDLKKMLPDVEILMLTSSDDDDDIYNALRLGASGYLLKDVGIDGLIKALDEISSGGSPLSGNVARKILNNMRSDTHDIKLTNQESKLLRYIVDGYSQKEIADKMYISLPTVKFHSSNLYEKLNVKTKAEAIAKAVKLKLV